MKPIKYAVCAAIMALALTNTQVQGKAKMVPRMYMFGISASFTDSVVYFTDVQPVDSAWIDTKTNFLLGRDNYSLQLKNHLSQELSMPNRTCIVFFGKNRSAVEKDYLKLKKQYTAANSRTKYDVRNINSGDFRFKGIDMSFITESETEAQKPEKTKKPDRKKPERAGMPQGNGGMRPGNGGMPPEKPRM